MRFTKPTYTHVNILEFVKMKILTLKSVEVQGVECYGIYCGGELLIAHNALEYWKARDIVNRANDVIEQQIRDMVKR